jgi:hypothetical protein
MKTVVTIGTPCFGGLVTQGYTLSLIKLINHARKERVGINVNLVGGDALITRARNGVVAEFLHQPDTTHLLFVDADISFEPEQIMKLLAFDKDVVAAMYPAKNFDWANVSRRVQNGEPIDKAGMVYVAEHCVGDQLKSQGDFVTAEYAGTGCLLIKRHVFERMIAAYPETKYTTVHGFPTDQNTNDKYYALFDCIIDPQTGHYLSEDYAFCKRWRKLGGEIWIDVKSKLTHTGPYAFAGDASVAYAPVRQVAQKI